MLREGEVEGHRVNRHEMGAGGLVSELLTCMLGPLQLEMSIWSKVTFYAS